MVALRTQEAARLEFLKGATIIPLCLTLLYLAYMWFLARIVRHSMLGWVNQLSVSISTFTVL